MAPVAGGIPDAQQDRQVAALGLGQRLRAPLPPVDRVVGVLAQVGRLGLGETIGHDFTLVATARTRWPRDPPLATPDRQVANPRRRSHQPTASMTAQASAHPAAMSMT